MLASATRAGTSSTKPGLAEGAVRRARARARAGDGGSGTPIVVTDAGQEVTVSQFVAQLGSFRKYSRSQ
jgi:hypothetical protein